MNGKEIAAAIEQRIKTLLPDCFVSVKYDYSIYPSIYLRFAKGKDRAAWSNGIIQNDPLFMLVSLDGFVMAEYAKRTAEIEAGQLKDGKLRLDVKSNNNHKYLPLRGKTATADKMIDYIEGYFMRVKAIL